MFGNNPHIEFSETQQRKLLELFHSSVKESLVIAFALVVLLFILGESFSLIFLKILFVPCFVFAGLGLRLVRPRQAGSYRGMPVFKRAMESVLFSCMFLVIMVRPDRSVSQLVVMFGVMLLVTFLLSFLRPDDPGTGSVGNR